MNNLFKLRNILWDNRGKIRVFAHVALIVNTLGLGYVVYVDGLDLNGVSFWSWLLTFICFIFLQVHYREEQ